MTPLHRAILNGNTEVATFLIDNGANVNAIDVVSKNITTLNTNDMSIIVSM